MTRQTGRFAVVGCRECDTLWIVEDFRLKSTVECPQCEGVYKTKSLKSFANAETREDICEARSRILADRAGHYDEYLSQHEDGGDANVYVELDARAEAHLSRYDELFENVLSDSLTAHHGIFAKEVEALLQREPKFETLADASIDEHREKFSTFVEEMDEVGSVSAHIDRYYDSDEKVTVQTDAGEEGGDGEPSLVGSAAPDTGSLRLTTGTDTFADVVVDNPTSAEEIHRSLFAIHAPLQDALLEAAEDLADQVDHDLAEFVSTIEDLGDEFGSRSVGGAFVSSLVDALEGGNAYRVKKLVSQLGNNTFLDVRTGLQDVYIGPFAVFRGSDVTPKAVIRITADLFDTDAVTRETRENFLAYVAELARGCDVRLVATGLVQTRLLQEHRDILPASVIESSIARLATGQLSDDRTSLAMNALADINYTDSAWDVLHVICEGRTDTALYRELRNDQRLTFGRSRLSQCLSRLEEHELIITEGPQNAKYAIATPAGTAALDALEAQIGKQADLDSFGDGSGSGGVSQTPNSCADPCSPAATGDGGSPAGDAATSSPVGSGGHGSPPASAPDSLSAVGGDRYNQRNYSSGYARTVMLDHWEHNAAVACAPPGGIGFDDVPIGGVNTECFPEWSVDRLADKRSPIYSYEPESDELVVGAEFHQPFQYGIALARSLLSPAAFDQILTAERLDGKTGDLDALLNGNKAILRDKRCFGWLKDAHSGAEYRQALRNGLSLLEDLTHDIRAGEFSDEQRSLRREGLQLAHGLIGTAVGIYDLLDVNVTRLVRIPGRFSSNMSDDDRRNLRHFIVRAATISSIMGAYTQSRVQFEPDENKRQAIGAAPDVDMDDPTGTHIGQWSIVGYGVDEFQDELESALSHPEAYELELQTDAENYADFVVEIPLELSFSRQNVARAVRRSLADRSMRPTRHAVSVMQAFTGSVHDVAKALYYLGSETGRKVRVDDLKYALSCLPTSRIFPSANGSTKSKIVHALIRSAMPLSQKELVDRAEITAQSFRNHREELQAFGIIRETAAGWVVCLTYREVDFGAEVGDEHADALPWYTILDEESNSRDRARSRNSRDPSLEGVLYEAMLVLETLESIKGITPAGPGAMHGVLTPEDLRELIEDTPSFAPLVNFACALREEDPLSLCRTPPDETNIEIRTSSLLAAVGRPPDQSGLASFDGSSPATATD